MENEQTPTTQHVSTPEVSAPAAVVSPSAPAGRRSPQGQYGGFRRGGGSGGAGGRGGRGGRRQGGRPTEKPEFDQKTLDIARVARVTKGGKRFSFRATVVVGNGRGKVGVGIAKGKDVAQSILKAYNQGKKRMITVVVVNGTIPYQVEAKYSSAVVMIKPSKNGIKAGGAVRVVAQMAGIRGLTGKLIERTNNKLNIAMATLEALKKLRIKNKEVGIKEKPTEVPVS